MNDLLKQLRALEAEDYVRTSKHRDLPLSIWNYTPKTQYEMAFEQHPILRHCRGLVTDDQGNVVARPFAKFFNWGEHTLEDFPEGDNEIEVTEKMDGSLLIVFRYQDRVVYATRGSFYSDQALAGAELFRKLYREDWIEEGKTYLFEYVSPTNRIVLLYSEDDLVHLAVLDTSTGIDLERDSRYHQVPVHSMSGKVNFWAWDFHEQLRQLNVADKEGFVVRFVSHDEVSFRVKFKFDEYVRLHRIVTGVSNKTIWETLRSGGNFDDILEICPDEFNNWLKQTKESLESEYRSLESTAKTALETVKSLASRKEQASVILGSYPEVSKIVFLMLENREYSDHLWKMVKPSKYVQPFSQKEEV